MSSITLTDSQYSEVKKAAEWFKGLNQDIFMGIGETGLVYPNQAYTFCGYAGSGKSTCVASMIEELGLNEEQVMFMAPTGKAAKVLSGKLRSDGWNAPATTIHKAIYMPRGQKADALKTEIDAMELHRDFVKSGGEIGREHADSAYWGLSVDAVDKKLNELDRALRDAMDSDSPAFNLKVRSELPENVKLFVVDEASMVGSIVAQDLASFGFPILAIGDPGQLPPVEDTAGFNLKNPNTFLTEIHRQAAENPIIRLATMARNNQDIRVGNYGDGVKVVRSRDDDVTYDMSREAMILVGTHKTKWRITKKVRNALGITETGPMADEPILVCKNSKKYPALVNGTILRNTLDHGNLQKGVDRIDLTLVDEEANGFEYNVSCAQSLFEEHVFRKQNQFSTSTKAAYAAKAQCEQVDFGHVLTVHKSQGSEWDDVVVHDESAVFRADASKWLYTGITRSSDKLTVVVPA